MKKKIRYHLAPLQRSKKFRLPQWKQLPFFYPDPPNKGSGKSGSCYWAGGWRVVKKQSMSKIREVQKSVGSGAGTKSGFSIFFFMEIISKIYFL